MKKCGEKCFYGIIYIYFKGRYNLILKGGEHLMSLEAIYVIIFCI